MKQDFSKVINSVTKLYVISSYWPPWTKGERKEQGGTSSGPGDGKATSGTAASSNSGSTAPTPVEVGI